MSEPNNPLTPERCRTFVAMERHQGSVTATARELRLNEASVSKRIRPLVRGAPPFLPQPWLLKRGKKFFLTDKGKAMLPVAKEHAEHREVRVDLVRDEELGMACGKRSPWSAEFARTNRPVKFDELKAWPLMLPEADSPIRRQWDERLRRQESATMPQVAIEVGGWRVMASCVVACFGVGLLPRDIAADTNGQVHWHPLAESPRPTNRLYAVSLPKPANELAEVFGRVLGARIGQDNLLCFSLRSRCIVIQPSVFISCVSPEFRTTRGLVSDVLLRLGFTPIKQEIFGTEAGDLRQVLRNAIDPCHGLIQLVGHGYGAEPGVESEFGRVSYTQFEYLYARSKGKKTWLLFVDERCPRDTPIHLLDLPWDKALPDPATYQAERRRLQDLYRTARQSDGHLFHPIGTPEQLLIKVEQLRNELDALRQEQRDFQATVTQQLNELTEQQKLTKEKIRVQLIASAEQTLQKSLAEAYAAPGWQQRQKLKDAAAAEHAARLGRIDELAQSFAEIEGTAQASDVLREMSRILAEEGVEEALAYIASLRTDILTAVKSRKKLAQEKNRRELQPLLKSVELRVSRVEFAEADALLTEILALEPAWTDALHEQCRLRFEQGKRAQSHETLEAALDFFRQTEASARQMMQHEPTNPRGESDLSRSLICVGDVKTSMGNLPAAADAFRSALEVQQRLAASDPANAARQRDLWVSHWEIANLLEKQGAAAAQQHWRAAHDILAGMVQAGLHVSPDDRGFLERMRAKVCGG